MIIFSAVIQTNIHFIFSALKQAQIGLQEVLFQIVIHDLISVYFS